MGILFTILRIWFGCLGVCVCVRNNLVRGLQFGFGFGCLGWDKHLNEFEKYMGILFTILRIWFGCLGVSDLEFRAWFSSLTPCSLAVA